MLIERYNEKANEFECFDDRLKFIAFTGYGDTKEKAKVAYFSIQVVKDPRGIINFNCPA